ncbi:M48 family metallopeptidase [Allosphingosinicella flava]|uniref:M48 family metallopeptidase n=1 Tax=Allosphingosinicella flava TaxID=2771430 RepID=A0A7T2GIS7_9SPHN|nr:M48 family metallopeptidase [Sphingosinicella flava]QPQ54661.1 M48 family metallopeptidase [Sphingosinicella flava]
MQDGWLYDGRVAVRRAARLEESGHGWRLVLTDTGDAEALDPSALRAIESRADADVYGLDGRPGWRLGLAKPIDPALAAHLPALRVYGGWIDRIGLPRALAAGLAVSAAVLFLANRLPDLLAPMVPFAWEQRFGTLLLGDLDANMCATPEGQRALDRLAARLSPDAGRYKVRVADLSMVNAVALPGGNIVIFKDLLIEAQGPDEVAGVLGHEMAHVEKRHVTAAMIRHFGFNLLLSSVGGNTGGNVQAVLETGYSRDAEGEADEGALLALRRAGISPAGTAAFFERLAKDDARLGRAADALAYLSTHPAPGSRRARFAAAVEKGRHYTPVLSAEEWLALQDICQPPPKGQAEKS